MTRLMIFAVIVVVMAVVAIQNPEATTLTILGARQTPEIPFGLLLVSAFSVGALLTIFLYGIVGLQRPPESKYRPMGRRVPYPENSGSTNLPPSEPAVNSSSAYASTHQSYGRSTAFVSEPSSQDTVPPSNSGSTRRGPASSSAASAAEQPGFKQPAAEQSVAEQPSVEKSAFAPPIFSNAEANPNPNSRVDEPNPEKKKRRFIGLGRQSAQTPKEERRIGDDWGELRTAEHLNSWNTDEVRQASGTAASNGKRGLLDFIGVDFMGAGSNSAEKSAGRPQTADQLADDIAAGWDETAGNYSYDNGPYDNGSYDSAPYQNSTYEGGLDSGWEQSYSHRSTHDRNAPDTAAGGQKRVYHDGLYSDSDYLDSDYPEGPYEATDLPPEEDVYEADYRVIVPPSKSLEEISPQDASDKENEPYD